MKTYIIETMNGEYYTGKTNDIVRRLKEHKNEKYPHWFSSKARKSWKRIILFNGDFEKIIKPIGGRAIVKLIDSLIKNDTRDIHIPGLG